LILTVDSGQGESRREMAAKVECYPCDVQPPAKFTSLYSLHVPYVSQASIPLARVPSGGAWCPTGPVAIIGRGRVWPGVGPPIFGLPAPPAYRTI
jgi:hypothetical protein